MVRRILLALTLAVLVAASSVAVQAKGQRKHTTGPWQIDFGMKPLPEPPPLQTLGHGGWAPATGPRQTRPFKTTGREGMFMSGLKLIPSPADPKPAKPAIDCAMLRPADPNIDPNVVRRVPGHPGIKHSLVMVPVTPCR